MTKGATVATRGHKAWLVIGGALSVFAVAACSEEKALSTIPTLPPTSPPPTVASTDTPVGSQQPTTSDTTSPPPTDGTSPSTDPSVPSTAVPITPATEDDLAKLRRQVERDFLRNSALVAEIAKNPTRPGLERRLGQALIPGSPRYREQLNVFRDMIALRQRIVLGEPPISEQQVEVIEFRGSGPFDEAVVTSCDVDNANLIAADRTGDTVFVYEPQPVRASRAVRSMKLTKDGWKEYDGYRVVETWLETKRCGN